MRKIFKCAKYWALSFECKAALEGLHWCVTSKQCWSLDVPNHSPRPEYISNEIGRKEIQKRTKYHIFYIFTQKFQSQNPSVSLFSLTFNF